MKIHKLFSTPDVFSPSDLNIYRRAQLLNFWIIVSIFILLKTIYISYINLDTYPQLIDYTYRFYSRLAWCAILIVSYILFKYRHMVALPAWVASLSVLGVIGEIAYLNPLHSAPLILLVPISVLPLMGVLWGGALYLAFAVYILFLLNTGPQIDGLLHPNAFFNNHMYALIIGGGATWFLEHGRSQVINKLHDSATKDMLTGCWNRRVFLKSLESEIQKVEWASTELTLVIFDIDHFKRVNDTYGHNTGDAVLADFASVINKQVSDIDVLARMGGEEFALLLPKTNLIEAAKKVENILDEVRNHTFAEVGSMTASAGLTAYVKGQLLKDCMHKADTALYMAKELGRNRLVVDDEAR
jgi:diguanylate cyclase (GGDEF)-like protein